MKHIAWIFFALTIFTYCSQDPLQKEQYKKIAYLLSGTNDDNTIVRAVNYYDDPNKRDTSYITCCVGGSTSIDKDVLFEIDIDEEILNRYNYKLYFNNTSKYTQLVSDSTYDISTFHTIVAVSKGETYSAIPFFIDTRHLQPDGEYYIPVGISRVVGGIDSINAKKNTVLIRVAVKNRYCAQLSNNTFFTIGSSTRYTNYLTGALETSGTEIVVNKFALTARVIKPVGEHALRLLPWNIEDKEENLKYSMVVKINRADNTVTVEPWDKANPQQYFKLLPNSKFDPLNQRIILNYDFKDLRKNPAEYYKIENQIIELTNI